MSSPPRVTAIMATYNWSSVLPYSIGSVLRQTLTDFELLVVGDGCTDDSEQVVASLGDPRVRWINLPANTGHQSGPNNEGLRQARGEIIAYLGHDDLWLPHHLALLVAALDRGADVAAGIVSIVWPDRSETDPTFFRPELYGYGMPPSGLLYRRPVLESLGGWRDYRELRGTVPDADLLQRAHAAGYRIATVPRLTAIKFPAGARRNVYRERPSHEQAQWLAHITADPDFEVVQLAQWVSSSRLPSRMRYRELAKELIGETMRRLRRRLAFPRRKGLPLDEARRFKGL